MTNFSEPTNVADLIGLWDFLSGNETADTGLDDGIAQNGNAIDGNGVAPSFSNDQLHVGGGSNSNPTVFDVNADSSSSADDEQFNLDRGTLEVQFTQSSHSGGSEDVILSRGEKDIDEDDEGFFEIRVTADGSVQSYHNTDDGDHEATLCTSDGFFSPGDVINVKYSFDEVTGARLTVENLTTGETESLVTSETGLTFDLTDNDDEEFTFGAREDDDGEYDKEFQGSIDYVALYTTTNDPVTNPTGPDGIVDGEESGEVMELGYDDANLPTDNGGDLITDGDDVIEGNGGDDTIDGAGGDDTIDGGTGDDVIAGGDGTNVLTGGAGDDTFIGGDGADSFQGNNGQDNLDYSGSDEAVNVNLATGTLSGGDADNDTIVGGIDGVIGSEFDDTLIGFDQVGTSPADTFTNELFGAGGDDTISGLGGDDLLDGGDDDDLVDGGAGDDSITGGDGSDTLSGGEGDDTIEGGEGDDDIAVGGGDEADGGTGDDVFTMDATDPGADTNVTIDGGSDGTDGNPDGPENGDEGDVLDLGDQTDDLTVDFAVNPEEGTVNGLDADGATDVSFEEIEKVITGSGDDTIDGSDATGGGIDVETGEGDDDVTGGDGDDTVDAGDGDDVVEGGDGDDSIEGGDGSDSLTGGEGGDTLAGGGDDDDITVGAGDTATGGSGDDEFYVDPALAGDSPITIIGGETGEDLSDPTNGGDGDTLDLRGLDLVSLVYDPTDPEAGTAVYNSDAGDPVTINFSEIEIVLHDPLPDGVVDGEDFAEIMGPGYDDGNLPTDGGGDLIDGADGDDDIIEGNGGDDFINAGQGSDTVSGGTGDDTILGGTGSDGNDLSGDEGNDIIGGASGNDLLDGGVGDDELTGFDGDDTLIGGDGSDSIFGSNGNDLIISGEDGSPDRDTPAIGPFPVTPGDADPFNDRDSVEAGAGDDTIFTGDDNDYVNADRGNDEIDGGFDDDTVNGGQGNDLIIGGEGSDSLFGNQDDDTIYGGIGPGSDSLDVADDGFNSPIGPDPVPDNGDDFIDGGAGNDLIFGQDDNDTILGGTGDDTIDGGVDDDSIMGGQGEDVIEGGHGQDFIQGNNDDDSISGGRGSDTLEGNAGDDTIIGGAGDSIIGGGDADSIFIDQDEVDENGDNDAAIFVEGNTFGDDNDTLDLTDFVAYRNLVENLDGDGDSTSGTVEVQNDELEWVPVAFNEIEDLLLPAKAPDGIVDGEETGEVMELGYDDANLPTDGGGDLITNGDDSIEGNGGDDSIQAAGGDDSVDGGTGDDTIRGNDGGDSLDGGIGNDSVSGGTGDDTINAGDGDDSVTGGSGDDVIDGGIGNDTITGSTGNDSITDLDGDNLINSDNPGSFNPDLGTPIPTGGGTGPFIIGTPDSDPNDNKDTITTGAGDDTINSGDDADVIDAGDGDNVIDGGTDADTITTGSGNDDIVGGEGSDLINSGDGDDTIDGGVGSAAANFIDEPNPGFTADPILNNGDDTINAGAGNDVVNGEDDNDLIDGGTGDDTLDGGIDDDTIIGGIGDDVIIGGQGADSLDGGTGDDLFNVGTFTDPNGSGDYQEGLGDTVVGGEDVGDDDIDTLDLTGGGALKVVFEDSIDPTGTSGESGTVIYYTDDTQTVETGRLEFKEIENVIPCFTPGAMIATPRGEVPVETLREGDKVITRDNGIQEIRWTGNRTLNRDELAEGDNLKPILVKAGSLGRNLPERDMLVSPQHRVLITGESPQLYFEESEVLVAAKHLVGQQGVSIMDTMRTTYIHFMFDRHEVVLSDGAWTESFQPGDQTLGAMGEASRDEIFALFPELQTEGGLTDYAAARRSLKAHEAKLLQL